MLRLWYSHLYPPSTPQSSWWPLVEPKRIWAQHPPFPPHKRQWSSIPCPKTRIHQLKPTPRYQPRDPFFTTSHQPHSPTPTTSSHFVVCILVVCKITAEKAIWCCCCTCCIVYNKDIMRSPEREAWWLCLDSHVIELVCYLNYELSHKR